LAHGFEELELRQIIALIDRDNAASIRVAQRLDMTPDRHVVHPVSRVRLSVFAKNAEDAGSRREAS
jgi:RimJ/RimL family protein N-acetyltransferase